MTTTIILHYFIVESPSIAGDFHTPEVAAVITCTFCYGFRSGRKSGRFYAPVLHGVYARGWQLTIAVRHFDARWRKQPHWFSNFVYFCTHFLFRPRLVRRGSCAQMSDFNFR